MSTTRPKEGDVLMQDQILAFGKPDAELAQQLGSTTAVAFLGKAKTYLLLQGGEALLRLVQLDAQRVELVEDSKALYLKDDTVWGAVHIQYRASGGQFSVDERDSLRKMGFTGEGAVMLKQIYVRGKVLDAVDVQSTRLPALSKPRALAFRAQPSTETKPNLGAVALLPLAVVVDVVTAPIQLVVGGLVLLGLSSKSTR